MRTFLQKSIRWLFDDCSIGPNEKKTWEDIFWGNFILKFLNKIMFNEVVNDQDFAKLTENLNKEELDSVEYSIHFEFIRNFH